MKKNGFAPTIIILTIAILGVVGYFGYKDYLSRPQPLNVVSPSLSNVSDPTINWKTYSNSDVGFVFKYPNSFIEKPIGTIYKSEEVKLFVGDNQYSLLLRLSSDSKAYNIENLKEFSNSTKSVGSYTAYLTSSVASGGEFSSTAVIPFGQYFIDISINPNGSDESKATATEEIRDQILSTFKFNVGYDGRYEYCQFKDACNYINIKTASDGKISVDGRAYWVGSSTTNTGEISGNIKISSQKAYYEKDGCKIDFSFGNNQTTLKEKQDSVCGGLNVSFDGIYIKK